MEDDELEKLREERMKKMQDSSREGSSVEERRDQQRDQIRKQAAKYLSSEARDRLGNLRAAKPDLAATIEMQVARMGKMGQIDQMGDEELKEILREIQRDENENKGNIKFRR